MYMQIAIERKPWYRGTYIIYIYNRRSYLVCEVSVRKECRGICFGSRPRGNSIRDRAARQKFASPVMRGKVGRAALDIYVGKHCFLPLWRRLSRSLNQRQQYIRFIPNGIISSQLFQQFLIGKYFYVNYIYSFSSFLISS